jgi:hypothetical protein
MRKFKEYTKEEFGRMTDEEFDAYEKERREFVMNYVYDLIELGHTTFINDHNGEEEKLEAIVQLDSGHVCPVRFYTMQCLNRLYVGGQDEKIHLSRMSVGVNLYKCKEQTDGTPESFMESAVKYYNEAGYSTKIISYKII